MASVCGARHAPLAGLCYGIRGGPAAAGLRGTSAASDGEGMAVGLSLGGGEHGCPCGIRQDAGTVGGHALRGGVSRPSWWRCGCARRWWGVSSSVLGRRRDGFYVWRPIVARGAATPFLWNVLVAAPLEVLAKKWRDRRPSLAWARGGQFGLLVRADSLFLLCDDAAELQLRVDEVQALFAKVGLEFSGSTLERLGNMAFAAPSRLILRRTNQEFSRMGQMRVQGVCIDDEGQHTCP